MQINKIEVIGSRHGEKLYETLLTREEFVKAEDLENYYRVPADNRDLNYAKYLEDGDVSLSSNQEYNSHNTKRLTVKEICIKILALDYLPEIEPLRRNF